MGNLTEVHWEDPGVLTGVDLEDPDVGQMTPEDCLATPTWAGAVLGNPNNNNNNNN